MILLYCILSSDNDVRTSISDFRPERVEQIAIADVEVMEATIAAVVLVVVVAAGG